MECIAILGCPGSGKSTFARRLRDATGLPLHHLDLLWHLPDGGRVSRADFEAAHGALVRTDRWIIDGNYLRTLDARLSRCDVCFLFDMPVELCLEGARARLGTVRDDLPWVEERLDEEFERYILEFPRAKLPVIRRRLAEHPEVRQIVFRTRGEMDAFPIAG